MWNLANSNVSVLVSWSWQMYHGNIRCHQQEKLDEGIPITEKVLNKCQKMNEILKDRTIRKEFSLHTHFTKIKHEYMKWPQAF